jgi:hypothetical protein
MDFGSIRTVAVVPFANLARDQVVSERVRDVFVNRLLSTEAVYVLPIGEVPAESRSWSPDSSSPALEDVVKPGAFGRRHYGRVRRAAKCLARLRRTSFR